MKRLSDKLKEEIISNNLENDAIGCIELFKKVLVDKLNRVNEYNNDNEESRIINIMIDMIEVDNCW